MVQSRLGVVLHVEGIAAAVPEDGARVWPFFLDVMLAVELAREFRQGVAPKPSPVQTE
jgi:hypothetical protein